MLVTKLLTLANDRNNSRQNAGVRVGSSTAIINNNNMMQTNGELPLAVSSPNSMQDGKTVGGTMMEKNTKENEN